MKLSAPIYALKRRARLLAHSENRPLNQSLDAVARQEGFRSWAHLADRYARQRPAIKLLSEAKAGDLILLGARPGHGKTLLSMEMAIEAAREGQPSYFFSLQDSDYELHNRFVELGINPDAPGQRVICDTSDDLSIEQIAEKLSHLKRSTFAVLDYLQKFADRSPARSIQSQLRKLKACAVQTGTVIVVLSQINRGYDPEIRAVPELSDVELTGRIDLSVFTRSCFLHNGAIEYRRVAA